MKIEVTSPDLPQPFVGEIEEVFSIRFPPGGELKSERNMPVGRWFKFKKEYHVREVGRFSPARDWLRWHDNKWYWNTISVDVKIL